MMRFAIVWVGFFIVFTTWQKIKLFYSWLIIDDSVIVLFNFVCSCCGFLDHFWRRKPTFHACSCVVVSQAVVSNVFSPNCTLLQTQVKNVHFKKNQQNFLSFYDLVMSNFECANKVTLYPMNVEVLKRGTGALCKQLWPRGTFCAEKWRTFFD